jgi:branched-chain amino acid aminotransferase
MPNCLIKILTLDGLQSVTHTANSLAEAAQYEPHDGIYTITNTYNTFQVLKLDAHLNRMEDSARRENIPLKLDRPRLRTALRQMIAEAAFGSVRFRITAPRDKPDQLILSIEPFKPPAPEVYANGVRCMTAPGSARRNPAAKTTDWMHDRKAILDSLPAGIYEALLLDAAENILEGLNSNFYAVLDGELRTAGSGVLPGIAQQIVFEVAPQVLPVRKEAINVRDMRRVGEAFITSSSRGIVPVIEIDGEPISHSIAPDSCTTRLRKVYNDWVQAHLEEL